jgi:hypothetical protein
MKLRTATGCSAKLRARVLSYEPFFYLIKNLMRRDKLVANDLLFSSRGNYYRTGRVLSNEIMEKGALFRNSERPFFFFTLKGKLQPAILC